MSFLYDRRKTTHFYNMRFINDKNKKLLINLTTLMLIVLVSLSNGKAGAKIITALVKDYLKRNKNIKTSKSVNEVAFRTALSRLQKSGLVKRSDWGIWKITEIGRAYVDKYFNKINRYNAYQKLISENKDKDIKTVIIFDIPEKERYKRDMLRMELVALDFKQAQKSVWVGNTVIPKLFLEYLRDFNLLSYVRIFSVKELGTL